MKKIIAAVLALTMLLAFAGCSGNNAADDNTLKVALSPDFAPMEFIDSAKSGQDSYTGFDVTLAKYIAENLGKTLEIVPMSFDACQVAVEVGSVDMSISGFSWTEKRAANYNLSDYYYAGDNETEQTVVVKKELAETYAAPADFAGKTIAAQTASLQLDLCNAQLPDATVQEVGDLTTAILQLQNGDFDAIAMAMGNAEVIVANNPDLGITTFKFEVDESAEANVIMLQKGDDELTAQVNELLAKAKDAGYYDTWYNEALEAAGVDTAKEVSYDDEGNAIVPEESNPAE